MGSDELPRRNKKESLEYYTMRSGRHAPHLEGRKMHANPNLPLQIPEPHGVRMQPVAATVAGGSLACCDKAQAGPLLSFALPGVSCLQ